MADNFQLLFMSRKSLRLRFDVRNFTVFVLEVGKEDFQTRSNELHHKRKQILTFSNLEMLSRKFALKTD